MLCEVFVQFLDIVLEFFSCHMFIYNTYCKELLVIRVFTSNF